MQYVEVLKQGEHYTKDFFRYGIPVVVSFHSCHWCYLILTDKNGYTKPVVYIILSTEHRHNQNGFLTMSTFHGQDMFKL